MLEYQRARLAICSICEFKSLTGRSCTLCKCNLALKTLAKWSKCPKNKWKEEKEHE